ncbi:nitrous oxide reductase accessory protein NosL [Noviherbaspirillum denitrificans]|uniref:Nitrous oxide reductase accessory protein NosL n=1 Tax=Noviherbaspirillum denitrificans TaxID=1968433 RepID=A0A254TJG2_9BURK|nr:nitrous oxide reductase accessory protein NosL [Noviherbaspirillum denitrificans]OWW21452.1 nitrous oxide reductase accessory protein NosL [Noviherbaspirillum denitrificans]
MNATPIALLCKPVLIALVALLAACGKEAAQLAAVEPDQGTACALDGMVLKDYPGPKAQIHYKEGAPEFFCDLVELFSMVLAPEQKRPVAGIFVQDMGKTDWAQPSGHWVDAKLAYYVVGSKKTGSMGPTFGSFSSLPDAEAFVAREGGTVKRFEQMTLDMVSQPGKGAAHEDKMH